MLADGRWTFYNFSWKWTEMKCLKIHLKINSSPFWKKVPSIYYNITWYDLMLNILSSFSSSKQRFLLLLSWSQVFCICPPSYIQLLKRHTPVPLHRVPSSAGAELCYGVGCGWENMARTPGPRLCLLILTTLHETQVTDGAIFLMLRPRTPRTRFHYHWCFMFIMVFKLALDAATKSHGTYSLASCVFLAFLACFFSFFISEFLAAKTPALVLGLRVLNFSLFTPLYMMHWNTLTCVDITLLKLNS